jgi:hypothetical protein
MFRGFIAREADIAGRGLLPNSGGDIAAAATRWPGLSPIGACFKPSSN